MDKYCPRCRETKPLSEFQKNKATKDGLQYHCKFCRKIIDTRDKHRQQHRDRYHSKKDEYLNSTYKRKYGITLEEYKAHLDRQGAVCAICRESCKSGRRLSVDHDHSTGEVRGLLCGNCNKGLGNFRDNIQYLNRAIGYLMGEQLDNVCDGEFDEKFISLKQLEKKYGNK